MIQLKLRNRSVDRHAVQRVHAPELLETRQLLAADMLVSVFNDTGGLSVLRYDEFFQPTAGGVPTSMSVAAVQGLAVAPDGTFFVSSLASGQVFQFDSDGTPLGALGAGDAIPAPIQAPGTLKFGPNGNLYVGDLQSASIFQFDTSSPTQQFLPSETLFLGYAPGGFDFEDDGDLVVGDLFFQGLNHYDTLGNQTVWIDQFSGINPAAVLVRPDGNVLIGDITFGQDPFDHHQVLLYDVALESYSQFIDLSFPFGTGDAAGFPAQPTALAFAPNGDLLVGASPDQNNNAEIQRYNPVTGAYIETLVSDIGTPTSIAFLDVTQPAAEVVGRHIFYNQSIWDGNSSAIDANDDNAIAPDKVAFDGIGTAPLSAFTNYSRGINGIMVDIEDAAGTLTVNDFTFKVGTNNMPSLWANAPAPNGFSVRAGAGVGGSDRVVITWANEAIKNEWLQVIVEGNDALGGFNTNTGLAASDVFFYGNRIGDTFEASPATIVTTNVSDQISVRTNSAFGQPITAFRDFNKDGLVNVNDEIIARSNGGFLTRIINWVPPAAPEAEPAVASDDSGSAVASALASSSKLGSVLPKVPGWISSRLASVSLNTGTIAKVFTTLAEANTPRTRALLLAANATDIVLAEPDELLAALLP